MKPRALLAASAVLALASPLELLPQEKKKEDPMSWDRSIRPLFQTFCYRCHSGEKSKGDVNLAQDENPRLIAQNRKTWETVMDVLEEGQMPPSKQKQPTGDQRKQILAFLKKTLGALDCEKVRDPGKPVVRRLNRTEYDNSILALTGLNLRLSEGFSPDASSYGFDTIAEALAVSPVLVEQYHDAARKILAEVEKSEPARRRIFFVKPDGKEAARRILEKFASRAFRRPVEPAFLEKLMALYEKALFKGERGEGALRAPLTAILISPRFLMRMETSRPGGEGAYPVDEYDLASRLSFFLWSAPPDDELLELASRGALAGALEAQTRRMLADPRGRALAENFLGQWLQLRGLSTHKPDTRQFPEFSEALRAAMGQELELFLGEIVRQDRPLMELIDADYTYVNEVLARHYGLESVSGAEMRRVKLPDRRRGGVLTTAAVLMIQSDPERNNVPRRGNYIAGAILGTPPPPPPPDVPALEESKGGGKPQTLRQLLELHRRNPECASCHAKIDPLGFGLENFDAIGRWRDREAGLPVDASGILPNGKKFNGPIELKDVVLARREDFVRTLTENMLIYALGRGLQLEDECVVRDALKAAAANEYRFSAVVLTVVRSFPFRHRKNPEF